MKKRYFLLLLLPIFAFSLWPLHHESWDISYDQSLLTSKARFLNTLSPSSDTSRPNIILIMADDLGKTDISLYGNPHIQTTHLDQLGQGGITFDEATVCAPICSPSRAGILTGRYPQRYGYEFQPHDRYPKNRLEYFVYKYFIARDDWQVAEQSRFPEEEEYSRQGLPPSEITIAELLQKQGYRTGIAGKWHLGWSEQSLPNNCGFDDQYGFYEAFSWHVADTTGPEVLWSRHSDFSDPFIWGKERNGTCAIRRNDEVIEEETYLSEAIAREAKTFIDQNENDPFFLYLPFLAPHTPFQTTKKYYDRFPHIEDHNQRVYYAMIASLDDAVGEVVSHLKLKGLYENTLIIFLSDNGGATYTEATDNAPLKGGKFTHFEGGLNVPFMLSWPARIKTPSRLSLPISSLDIFPTIAAAAQAPLPDDRIVDGQDLIEWAEASPENKKQLSNRPLFWRALYSKATRRGSWKLIKDELSGSSRLYHLESDKEEKFNLTEQLPDTLSALEAILTEWESQLQAPAWPRVMDYRFEDKGEVFWFPL